MKVGGKVTRINNHAIPAGSFNIGGKAIALTYNGITRLISGHAEVGNKVKFLKYNDRYYILASGECLPWDWSLWDAATKYDGILGPGTSGTLTLLQNTRRISPTGGCTAQEETSIGYRTGTEYQQQFAPPCDDWGRLGVIPAGNAYWTGTYVEVSRTFTGINIAGVSFYYSQFQCPVSTGSNYLITYIDDVETSNDLILGNGNWYKKTLTFDDPKNSFSLKIRYALVVSTSFEKIYMALTNLKLLYG